jgi:hypothetical protein
MGRFVYFDQYFAFLRNAATSAQRRSYCMRSSAGSPSRTSRHENTGLGVTFRRALRGPFQEGTAMTDLEEDIS